MISKKIIALVLASVFVSAINGCPLEEYVAPVPKTGQTTCFDTEGVEIDCRGTGQDGEYQKGAPWPNPRFTDNGDGTITDNLTGLIWLKDANCFGVRSWDEALSDCNELSDGSCGLSDGSSAGDWRLPSLFALESLRNMEYWNPALPNTTGTGQWSEGDPFTNVASSFYWSSTTVAVQTSWAWNMYVFDGTDSWGNKNEGLLVWPVKERH